MPQSLSNILLHLVFSTKDRMPWLSREIRDELYPYLGAVLRNFGCTPLQIGGVEDHVHILFVLARTTSVAQVVEKTKTSSSKWTKGRGVPEFAWQAGYGVFSVGPTEREAVIQYIQGQEVHHQTHDFQDELRAMLEEAGVLFDERYVWD
ncbi:MAG: IS200/IS605 family transposase [Armatimonadetes bacterium]|nr:IS200/IS605 family transposase [Armatimonadota bacterium]